MQTFCFSKNIFIIKILKTNEDKNSGNFTIVSDKNFKHFWVLTSTLQPSLPTLCTRFVEKTTKASVAINPHFLVNYGQKTFLTPYPGLLHTNKKTYRIITCCKSACY